MHAQAKIETVDRTSFDHTTTADQVLEGLDITNKRVLITGGSSGIGAETARALAVKGAEVIITARNRDKGQQVLNHIISTTGNTNVYQEALELDSLEDIRSFSERITSRFKRLDILINNAGVMACPYLTTQDGYEMQFGTNHLGHFLLTGLLIPLLVPGSRIVNLSSRGHQLSPVVFEDILYQSRPYEKWEAYGQSKTANILHAVGLDQRLANQGIRAFALHPGAILTDLLRHMDQTDIDSMNARREQGIFKMKSVEQGAATSVYVATAPELEDQGGIYLADCQMCSIDDELQSEAVVRSYAVDHVASDKLWQISESMVETQFNF